MVEGERAVLQAGQTRREVRELVDGDGGAARRVDREPGMDQKERRQEGEDDGLRLPGLAVRVAAQCFPSSQPRACAVREK